MKMTIKFGKNIIMDAHKSNSNGMLRMGARI